MRPIDADAVINRYYAEWEYHYIRLDDDKRAWLIQCIGQAPTLDVEPVRHGRWIISSDGYYPYCSECKEEPKGGNMTKYCPNCGAKMDLKGE